MRHPANHIFDHTPESLAAWCTDRGWPAFRAKQILEWVYAKGVADPAAMTNLPAATRERLAAEMAVLSGEVMAHEIATDETQKLLVQWGESEVAEVSDLCPERDEERKSGEEGEPSPRPLPRGESAESAASRLMVLNNTLPASDSSRQTECVMIPSQEEQAGRKDGLPLHRTACISSQVGCPVGCRFCASGLGGLDGNLSAGRIVEQAWRLGRLDGVGRITNVVFMGMGEPLANLSNVVRAVQAMAAPWGLGISARRITISTVGLPGAIRKLADQLDLPVTLALSLHAPDDAIRRDLIPSAQYTTIDELLGACDAWFEKTGREITLEYTLLGGVNDQPKHAEELVRLAKRLRANVNLIRYNEVEGLPYERPRSGDVHRFQKILRARRVNAHIRASRGRDIAAACGQLRHEHAGV